MSSRDKEHKKKEKKSKESKDKKSKKTSRKKEKEDHSSNDDIRAFFEKQKAGLGFDNSFESKRIVGCGSFGMVSLVNYKGPSASSIKLPAFAIKSVDKGRILGHDQFVHVTSEFEMLKMMNENANSVQLYGVFHDKKYVHYITDFIQGGELFMRIYPGGESKGLHLEAARFYFAEVVGVFEFMHARNVVYRDLKPENILIDAHGHIKIIDYGFAKNLSKIEGGKTVMGNTSTICGTMEYLAPEVAMAHLLSERSMTTGRGGSAAKKKASHDTRVDLWGLGIFLYELASGTSPFQPYSMDPVNLCKAVIKGKMTYPEDMDETAKDLIKRCLRKAPDQRIGNEGNPIHGHKFLKERFDSDGKKHVISWDDVLANKLAPPWKPKLAHSGDSSKFKRPYDEEIEEFGSLAGVKELDQNYLKVFGPLSKSNPPTFKPDAVTKPRKGR